MVYRSETFRELDSKLRDIPEFEEVPLKRFRHKRAFRFYGTLCEITLVQGGEGPVTLFWGDAPFLWDTPLLHGALVEVEKEPISVVSASNLKRYRDLHRDRQPHRWREPQALEAYE
ncbi:hypothetical protein BN77_2792 [Rhizobium mesoamericanum STM3625]|uniref:Uncharacterized protein n=2 Tax=Rhizobium mesoamericanum TaxID=1079800 RepID=K0PP43_9HYPH|nr:hypothetical protein BN77_2792 [Rhizobium mesoamericanum STM3625]